MSHGFVGKVVREKNKIVLAAGLPHRGGPSKWTGLQLGQRMNSSASSRRPAGPRRVAGAGVASREGKAPPRRGGFPLEHA